jgi:tRNA uridine 5-carboxymethylaminomethyl modification enzyme
VRLRKEALARTIADFRTRTLVWLGKTTNIAQLLRQPNIGYETIEMTLNEKVSDVEVQREAEIEIKYETFLRREQVWQRELKNLDKIKIPKLRFSAIPSLSREVVEKLTALKPSNLGDALRISGITPAAIVTIYNYITQTRSSKVKKRLPVSRT